MNAAFDVLFGPLRFLPPMAGLLSVSFATSVLVVVVVALTADQRGVQAARDGMYAALLEMRLFNADLGAVMRAQVELLRQNGRYLRASVAPILWLLLPVTLIASEMDAFYRHGGLLPHLTSTLTVQMADGFVPGAGAALLDAPIGVRVESGAIWFPAAHQFVWRIVPETPGVFTVHVRIADADYSKSLVVSDVVERRSPARNPASVIDHVISPPESPLPPASPVTDIRVDYPLLSLTVLGWPVHWLVVFGVASTGFAWLLGKLTGVRF